VVERVLERKKDKIEKFEPKVTPVGFSGVIKERIRGIVDEFRQSEVKTELEREVGEILADRGESAVPEPLFDLAHKVRDYLDETGQSCESLAKLCDDLLLTEEEIAVTFARVSRTRETFEETVAEIQQEGKVEDFLKKWVVSFEGFGHASVAEHAVVHLRVDNVSSLAVDWVTDARLGSFTEFSARYQEIPVDYYYTPEPIEKNPLLRRVYRGAQEGLTETYKTLVSQGVEYLKLERACQIDRLRRQNDDENDRSYEGRLTRTAQDYFKNLASSARLSNVGMTVNARQLEHIITKFLSSGNEEVERLGTWLKIEGQKIVPTLVKYADRNDYLVASREAQEKFVSTDKDLFTGFVENGLHNKAFLLDYDRDLENSFLTAFCYKKSRLCYRDLYEKISQMSYPQKEKMLQEAFDKLGTHDALVREAEWGSDYKFEFYSDYGLTRELHRHRMNFYDFKDLTPNFGYYIPPLAQEMEENGFSGTIRIFEEAIKRSEDAYEVVERQYPEFAPYLVTRSHIRPALFKMNFRQLFYFGRLRTTPRAHYTARMLVGDALLQAKGVHPLIWRHLKAV
jgi:thymidylate synthase ThyX